MPTRRKQNPAVPEYSAPNKGGRAPSPRDPLEAIIEGLLGPSDASQPRTLRAAADRVFGPQGVLRVPRRGICAPSVVTTLAGRFVLLIAHDVTRHALEPAIAQAMATHALHLRRIAPPSAREEVSADEVARALVERVAGGVNRGPRRRRS